MKANENNNSWQLGGSFFVQHPELRGFTPGVEIHEASREEEILYGKWGQAARDAHAAAVDLTPDDLARIYSLAMGAKRDAAVLAAGFVPAERNISIRRLIGLSRLRRAARPSDMPDRPPHDDHGVLFLRANGSPSHYLSEPYGLAGAQLAEIQSFCRTWGLDFAIDSRKSLWNPGETLAITYTRNAHGDCEVQQ